MTRCGGFTKKGIKRLEFSFCHCEEGAERGTRQFIVARGTQTRGNGLPAKDQTWCLWVVGNFGLQIFKDLIIQQGGRDRTLSNGFVDLRLYLILKHFGRDGTGSNRSGNFRIIRNQRMGCGMDRLIRGYFPPSFFIN